MEEEEDNSNRPQRDIEEEEAALAGEEEEDGNNHQVYYAGDGDGPEELGDEPEEDIDDVLDMVIERDVEGLPPGLLPALGNPLRAGLGLLLGLGMHETVEDDISSDEGQEEENEGREQFDNELPGLHAYLGEGREVRGRRDLEDEVSLPLLPQPGLSLIPGQLLPLHLFHPTLISMMQTVIKSPSKIFGVVNLRTDTPAGGVGTIGTTAQIFEVREAENLEVGSPPGRPEVGMKLKARGRQRFKLISARRQADGNLIGQVTILPEKDLQDPLWAIRLKNEEKLTMNEVSCQEGELSPEERQRSFSLFSCLKSKEKDEKVMPKLEGQRRRYKQGRTRCLTPIPPWIWDLYDPVCLMNKIKGELAKLRIFQLNMETCLSEDPTELSWWVATNLPLGDNLRAQLLSVDCAIQRLRLELSFLEQCRVLVCRRCGRQLGDQAQIFSMSKEGPQGAFVNPGGHVHETLTLHRAKNLRLVGRPSTEYSWFPGYAWTIIECNSCWNHIGWKFTSTSSRLTPEKFYGFSRKSIETKVEVPAKGEQEPEEIQTVVM